MPAFEQRRRRFRAGTLLLTVCALVAAGLGTSGVAHAGDLAFFEASSAPGAPLAIATPATNVPLDIDYGASSAEGGGIYGLSELRLGASGDLTFEGAGFACTITACLYAPFPWLGGREVSITGGEDLAGETAGSLDLLSLSVSGTAGYVFVFGGEYLDATGVDGSIGRVRSVAPTIIATVPEPGLGLGLVGGSLLLAAAARRRS